MLKKSMGLTVFSYGLIAICGCGIVVSLFLIITKSIAGNTSELYRPLELMGIYCLECFGLFAILRLQEWGRKFLIVLNSAAGLCLLTKIIMTYPSIDILSVASIILCGLIIIFLCPSRISQQFQDWSSTGKRILVVDDEQSFLTMIKTRLSSKGFDVITADTGEQGLLMAQQKNPDLIILDVILPGMKGREVCSKIKQDPKTKNIPVIFLTAKDSPDDIKAEKEAGAATHMTKPLDSQRLIDEIKRILKI